MNDELIVITGPTAMGKSEFAIKVAKKIDAEIISADSIQIYKGLDIGTGKLKKAEMCGIVHHMIDIVSADASYSVQDFALDAKKLISEIIKRGKRVVIVGGTGFYINALLLGYNLSAVSPCQSLRKELEERAKMSGSVVLHGELEEIDPLASKKIKPTDTKRIIRALEVYRLTGNTISELATSSCGEQFNYRQLVLNCDRASLYDRINRRVDKMISEGLAEEVKGLIQYRNCQSMQAIGYKEFFDYFDGRASLLGVIDKIKQHTRNYAKRQLTYFRWMKTDKEFIDIGDLDRICAEMV